MLLQERAPIFEDDTASTLGARTDNVAARLLVDAVEKIATGTAPRIPQDPAIATHWPRRRPEDGVIDWNRPSADVVRWIRALTHPYPGAFTHIGGQKLFIWEAVATTAPRGNVPGEILARDDDRLTIATCDGAVAATSFQWADQSNGMTSEGNVIARIRSAS
ncbi:MAG TPA: hypothetical protein DCL54_11510 [Alphaproteobacteria bacterium]|nr:hypothetical protein [Alphaproteobacteria bacterium]